MLDRISREAGQLAKSDLVELRDRLARRHAAEQETKRKVLDKLRRKYEKLRAKYLAVTGTTHTGWEQYGPAAEWEEVLAASRDDAVWDRLVERCAADRGPP